MSDSHAPQMLHFEEQCRRHGLALTVQRRAVFEALYLRRDHPTADQVYAAVRHRLPGVSRTTVYRVLETFVRAGLITKACHPGAAARYDPVVRRHHHLVCLRCEKIVDFLDSRLDHLPRPKAKHHDFVIDDYCVHFRGLCGECAAKPDRKTPATRPGPRRSASRPLSSRPRRAKPPKRRKTP